MRKRPRGDSQDGRRWKPDEASQIQIFFKPGTPAHDFFLKILKILSGGTDVVGRSLGRRASPEAPLLIQFSSENASFEVKQALRGAHPATAQFLKKIKK